MSKIQASSLDTRPKHFNDASSRKSLTACRTQSFQPESNPLLQTFRKMQWLKMRQKDIKVEIKAEEIKKNAEFADLEEEELIENCLAKKIISYFGVLQPLGFTIWNETKRCGFVSLINNSFFSQRIADLQIEYFDCATSKTIQEMIVKRLQLGDVLYKALVEKHDDNRDMEDNNNDINKVITEDDRKELKELLSEQTKLSAEISLELQEVNELESQILKETLELSEIVALREQMMKNFQQREEKRAKEEEASKNEEIKRLREKTEKRMAPLHILNNILQTFIAHCGLNWADDKDLTELVISLGKTLEQQLEESKISISVHKAG